MRGTPCSLATGGFDARATPKAGGRDRARSRSSRGVSSDSHAAKGSPESDAFSRGDEEDTSCSIEGSVDPPAESGWFGSCALALAPSSWALASCAWGACG